MARQGLDAVMDEENKKIEIIPKQYSADWKRNEAFAEIIDSHQREIITLANLSTLMVIGENDATPVGCAVSVVNENLYVYLELRGTLSLEAELEKIRKKVDEIQKQHDKLSKVMSSTGYKEKVPEHIQQENVANLASLMQEILSLEEARQHIEAQANTNHD